MSMYIMYERRRVLMVSDPDDPGRDPVCESVRWLIRTRRGMCFQKCEDARYFPFVR